MLLGYGADVTLQNDGQESAFSVASPEVQELMISEWSLSLCVCVYVRT